VCGRYSVKVSQADLEKEFSIADAAFLNPRYNAAPGQRLTIIRSIDDVNSLETVRWGIIPSWSPDGKSNFMMINARADGLANSRVFKKLLDRQRCLVPASGFYEWEKRTEGKQPVHIVRKDGRPRRMAVPLAWRDCGSGGHPRMMPRLLNHSPSSRRTRTTASAHCTIECR
jgi:putative SOS response-associated peptidase YedK